MKPTVRAATVLVVAARVALGVLWLRESYTKYHAGFGATDIGFVVQGAKSNTRVPGFFAWFAENVMGSAPTLFGVMVPLTEAVLAIALIAGVLPRLFGVLSIALLASYWSADQLITQYPVMVVLAAVVLAGGELGERWALTPRRALTCRGRGRALARSG